MINLGMDGRPSSSATAEKALSFLSKGWREDLQLIRTRATSFKNLADRELDNFLKPSHSSIGDLPFVKRIKPKLSEIRSAYSSTEFLERWRSPRPTVRIDLSGIRKAIVSEVEGSRGVWRALEREEEEEWEWEPIRALKTRLKEFESNEFVVKLKFGLKSIYKEPQELKEVPPLDLPELLAYLAKQSGPLFDQLGIKRDMCDKVVEALCNRRKDSLLYRSLASSEASCSEHENISDELDFRIASVLKSTGHHSEASCSEHENISDELDFRIASVLKSTGHHYDGGFWTNLRKQDTMGRKHHVAIVTTASLPWMTGTAVNPLFRAAYLAKSANQNVTLLVPWLCKAEQELVYPNNLTFSSPEEQEAYIRGWVEERVGFKADFKISFYPGKFSKERRSIIPAGDTSQFIPSKEADIAILEEPEHLNWYHHGKRWTDKFNHVVGVVHTNYLEYIKREKNGALQAFFVKHINNLVARAYCHKILRLSAATQDLPRSVVCNVHGVNPKFLKVGEKVAAERECGKQAFSKGAYFLGKMVWAKGYRELIDLLAKHKNELDGFRLDVYGNGEDSIEVQSAAKKLDLSVNFLRGRDHADDSLHGYKVFINPSVSDVLCTATAEALAMGKFVVCADHPSNDFFREFPNCLTYKSSEDFVARVREALASEPQPLTPEQRYNLSWEAATQRFMEYSELDKVLNNGRNESKDGSKFDKSISFKKAVSMPNLTGVVDGGLAFAHYCLTGNEILRLSTGAIPGSRDYDKQHCQDLHLLPPQVQNPIYGW